MTKVLDLSYLSKKLDHKMSKDEVLELCAERVQWLTDQLFGIRDADGKLMFDQYQDKDGNSKMKTYRVGLLHKIEGVKEFNEETQKEEVMQPGLEQLFVHLQEELRYQSEVLDGIVLNQKIQTAMFATILKVSPQEWFDLTGDKNQEMNVWLQNYKTILDKNAAEELAKEKATTEKVSEFEPPKE